MDSDDTPGSPRKKPKLEEPLFITSAIHHSDAVKNTIIDEEQITAAYERMDDNAETKARQNSSKTPNHEPVPTTNASIDLPRVFKSATSTTNPMLDQLIRERACGITEFVSSNVLGFSGVLKKRYTDFMVNEILPSGEVVHLINLKSPQKEELREEEAKQAALESKAVEEASKNILSPQNEPRQVIQGMESISEPSTPRPTPPVAVKEDKRGENEQQEAGQEETKQEDTKHEETPLPHERTVLPQLVTELKSGNSPKSSPTKETRTRQQFHLRPTNQGWAEFDNEDKEKEETVNGSATMNAAAGIEQTGISLKKEKDNMLPKEEPLAAARMEQVQTDSPSKASPQAKWQAYADPNGDSPTAHKISDEDKEILLSYFTEPIVNAIRSLYNRVLNSPRRATRDYGTVKSAVTDRHLRTKIHQDIRRIFQSRLETMTDKDGAIIVSAMPRVANSYNSKAPIGHNERGKAASKGNHQSSRGHPSGFGRPNWQELGGDFLHFTLYKENKDTMECISWLSKVLKLGPRAFEFAGTKDRRAVSVQRVSVYRQTINRMIDAGKSLRQAHIGDYEYRPHALQLGELTGNEFTITLRDCTFNDSKSTGSSVDKARSIVSKAIKCLIEQGFVNYYGLQRFGTFSTGTDDVGVKMLQGDFKGAVEAILHYTPESLAASEDPLSADDRMSRDDKARLHAIHAFRTTGKAQRALADLPRKFSAESAIIRHLGSKPNQAQDYLGAIQSVQRNLRLMYVHAYQSLVWNMAASRRWSMYGDSVVEGDLVLVNEHTDKEEAPTKGEEIDEDGELVIKPAVEDRANTVEDIFTRARSLSKEDAESGSYTIFDVVLPTPGFDILYPANEMQNFYEDFMASPRGGGLNPHDMRRPQKDFSLSGSYRKVLAKPGKDSSFEIKTYQIDDEQFVETDMDRLNKALDASKPSQQENAKNDDTTSANENAIGNPIEKETGYGVLGEDIKADSDEDADSSGGVSLRKIAVVLKLQLGASQYATMALRELMKDGGVKTYKPDFRGGR